LSKDLQELLDNFTTKYKHIDESDLRRYFGKNWKEIRKYFYLFLQQDLVVYDNVPLINEKEYLEEELKSKTTIDDIEELFKYHYNLVNKIIDILEDGLEDNLSLIKNHLLSGLLDYYNNVFESIYDTSLFSLLPNSDEIEHMIYTGEISLYEAEEAIEMIMKKIGGITK